MYVWESLGQQGDQISHSSRKSTLIVHWKDWHWSRSASTLATWCQEPTHWKRPWCWERLKVGGKGDDRGWDGRMASPLDEHEFEQTLGVGDGQGSLACCSAWSCKESNTTEWLNQTELKLYIYSIMVAQMVKNLFAMCKTWAQSLG